MAILLDSNTAWIGNRVLSGGGPVYAEQACGAAVGVGTFLVAAMQIMGDKVVTFSDSVNGAWPGGNIHEPAANGALGARWAIGWFENSAAGTPVIRGTLPDDTVNRTIRVAAYTGVATTSAKDGTATTANNTSDSPMNPGSITSTGDALFIGLTCWSSPAGTPTPAASFTAYHDTLGDYNWSIEDRIVTGAATVAPSWSNKTFWQALGIAFKSAGGGGGGGGGTDGPIAYVRRNFFHNTSIIQY